jgi:hypothetical protein
MARRAGMTNGLLVFLVGLLLAVGAGALANAATDSGEIMRNLRSLGIPTRGSDWVDAGLITGIASLAAMLLGSLFGGVMGERWHGKLLARALDPGYGADAVDRRHAVERPASTSVRTSDDEAEAEAKAEARADRRDATVVDRPPR